MLIAAIATAYLIGFPYGYVAGKVYKGVDLRQCGSGNLGASNTLRVLGKKAGIGILIADMAKGVVIVRILPLIFCRESVMISKELFVALVAAAGVTGHNWPVWLRFDGGKGVAITVGILLGIAPVSALCALGMFVAVVATLKYISLGSIVLGITAPIWMWIFGRPSMYIWFGIAAGLSIIFQHRSNIKRLIRGTENKLGQQASSNKQQN